MIIYTLMSATTVSAAARGRFAEGLRDTLPLNVNRRANTVIVETDIRHTWTLYVGGLLSWQSSILAKTNQENLPLRPAQRAHQRRVLESQKQLIRHDYGICSL
jgi:L-fucose isomerase-like protein